MRIQFIISVSMTLFTFVFLWCSHSTNPEQNFQITIPEDIAIGEQAVITWTSGSSGEQIEHIRIDLFSGDSLAYCITEYTLNDGTYTWPLVPAAIGSGNNFRIRLTDADSASDNVSYSGNFTITSEYDGTFIVTAPRSGVEYFFGEEVFITWEKKGRTGDSVVLELVEGTVPVHTISMKTANDGTYTWQLEDMLPSGTKYRIRILSWYDYGIVSYSEFFKIDGLRPDTFEIDDRREGLDTLESGFTVSRSLTADDTDWVAVFLEKDSTYGIFAKSAASAKLFIYPADSRVFSFSMMTECQEQWCNGYSEFTPDSSGIYLIMLTPYKNTGEYAGNYELTLQQTPRGGTIVISRPKKNEKIADGENYYLRWDPSVFIGTEVSIKLYLEDSLLWNVTTGRENSGEYKWFVTRNIETDSSYQIRIFDEALPGFYGSSEPFTIDGLDADEYEDDDSRSRAVAMEIGDTLEHTLCLRDTDWISLELDSGSSYYIHTTGTAYPRVEVFDGNDLDSMDYANVAESDSGYIGSMLYDPEEGGRFFLRVTPELSNSSYLGTYVITVTGISDRDSIAITSPAEGDDWKGGTEYSITWDTTVLPGTSCTVELMKDDTVYKWIAQIKLDNGIFKWTVPECIGNGDNYRIGMRNLFAKNITGLSERFTIQAMAPDEYENDDSREKAQPFTIGTIQQRTLTWNDTDWVALSLVADSVYYIRTYGGGYVAADLFASDSSLSIASLKQYSDDPAFNLMIICQKTGTYYLMCRCQYSRDEYYGTYELSVFQGLDQGRVGVTEPSAGAVLESGGQHTIVWDKDGIDYGDVSLLLYRDTVFFQNITGTENNGSFTWNLPASIETGSTYRIRVQYRHFLLKMVEFGYSEMFTINGLPPDEYEPDNTWRTAAPVAPDGNEQHRTLTWKDIDWVSFVTEKDSIYWIWCNSDSVKSLHLYRDIDSLLIAGPDDIMPSSFFWQAPFSDTVLLEIQSVNRYNWWGEYTLCIQKFHSNNLFTIVEPDAGTIWNTGTVCTIQWTKQPMFDDIPLRIYLALRGTDLLLMGPDSLNSGMRQVLLGNELMTGDDYQIRLEPKNVPLPVSVLSEPFSVIGVLKDEYEPDDIPAQATAVDPDSLYQRHTIALGDTDWFSFPVLDSTCYRFGLEGDSVVGMMKLFGDEGRSQKTVRMKLSDSSVYRFWVSSYAEDVVLQVTGTGGEYHLSIKTFRPDEYRYRVTAPEEGASFTAGSTVTITWTADVLIGEEVAIHLLNGEGVVWTVSSSRENNGSATWEVPTGIVDGGGYYIKIVSRDDDKIYGVSGMFSLTEN